MELTVGILEVGSSKTNTTAVENKGVLSFPESDRAHPRRDANLPAPVPYTWGPEEQLPVPLERKVRTQTVWVTQEGRLSVLCDQYLCAYRALGNDVELGGTHDG